jgi:branched-chain amino acid transport system substrate-binding protein
MRYLRCMCCSILVFGIAFVSGCSDDKEQSDGCTTKIEGTSHYIGGLLPYTGPWAVGENFEKAIILAVEQINAKGGIDGQDLGLITCDTAGDQAQGTALMKTLGERTDMGGIIGPGRSVVAIGTSASDSAAMAEAVKANKLMITPSATSPLITDLDDDDYIYRTTVSDAIQGKILAKIAEREGFKKVYVLQTADDPYTQGIREVFMDTFEAATDQDAEYTAFTTETPNQLLTTVKTYGADAILLSMFADNGGAIIDEYASFNWGGNIPALMGPDGLKSTDLVNKVTDKSVLDNLLGTAPAAPEGADYDLFKNAYKTKWSEDPFTFGAHAYDAAYLIAIAMTLADNPGDGEELKMEILNSQPGAAVPVFKPGQWDQILAELKANGKVDYDGAAGSQDFDGNGDVLSNISEWTFSNGNGTIAEVECWTADGTTDCL